MRIAQVAPLIESVPPKLYGGTERVVSYLTEELVRGGHDVTLYASGDSKTAAKLVAGCERALRLDPTLKDSLAYHMMMLERVFHDGEQYDIVHFHTDYTHFPFSRRSSFPTITTLHGRLDIAGLSALYREFSEMPVVSISDAQRAPLPHANWAATIHHGLPNDLYRFREKSEGYLAFIGRISPEKGCDRAVEIAAEAGLPLKVAAKVDQADREYFETVARPLFDRSHVDFVGEIGEAEKGSFLGGASALVFPIDWPEPFGLVMIEAMACGTPVVAYQNGSVGEVIDDGTTGCIVDGVAEAAAAVGRALGLDRRKIREVFERRFTAERMAADYVDLYQRLVQRRREDVTMVA